MAALPDSAGAVINGAAAAPALLPIIHRNPPPIPEYRATLPQCLLRTHEYQRPRTRNSSISGRFRPMIPGNPGVLSRKAGRVPPIDYMPFADSRFNSWQGNFVAYTATSALALGLSAGDAAA